MNKAILILDKQPTCCKNCPLVLTSRHPIYNEWQTSCFITEKRLDNLEQIDKNCPLQVLTNMGGEQE